jgi:hypothetical protein
MSDYKKQWVEHLIKYRVYEFQKIFSMQAEREKKSRITMKTMGIMKRKRITDLIQYLKKNKNECHISVIMLQPVLSKIH